MHLNQILPRFHYTSRLVLQLTVLWVNAHLKPDHLIYNPLPEHIK